MESLSITGTRYSLEAVRLRDEVILVEEHENGRHSPVCACCLYSREASAAVEQIRAEWPEIKAILVDLAPHVDAPKEVFKDFHRRDKDGELIEAELAGVAVQA